MPMMTVKGLVVSEHSVGESDKFISILTSGYGTIDVRVRGANKITGKNHAATQLFGYSEFCLESSRDRYYLNSSRVIYDFFNLRLDIKKLALACYMGEVARFTVLASNKQHENDVMRLILNCLYMLDSDKRSCEFIKSVFELRFVSEIGFIPQLIGCRVCYTYDAEEMFFLVDKAYVLCRDDFEEMGLTENRCSIKITPSELAALQFIALVPLERIFNFRLSEKSQAKINEITEKYILFRLNRSFNSLEYYHTVS